MHEATDASYAAVGVPVEGTILTVARAASDAALAYAEGPKAHARDLFTVAAAAAREALAHTPEQLQTLADAGVVDAGRPGPQRHPGRSRDGAHRAPAATGRRVPGNTRSRCRSGAGT